MEGVLNDETKGELVEGGKRRPIHCLHVETYQ